MLKPSLQLRLGQQLTMTPQLQQAIRLLQLPTIELQAHIRELLESNVMLEQDEDAEAASYESLSTTETAPETAAPPPEPPVEVVDDGWADQSVGPAENPWSSGGGDDDRQQEFADASGQSLRDHLLWQLELARLNPRDLGDRARDHRCDQRRWLLERAAGCHRREPQTGARPERR